MGMFTEDREHLKVRHRSSALTFKQDERTQRSTFALFRQPELDASV
jgi:hypothetical protein